MELPPTLIFDYPTVSALTAFVLSCALSAGTVATAQTSQPQPQDLETHTPGAEAQQEGTRGATSVLRIIQAISSEILGTDIGLEQPFAAAGLDSLAAVEVRNSLSRWACIFGAGSQDLQDAV